MELVSTAPRTVLFKLESVGIIPTILVSMVRPLSALSA